MKKSNTIMAFLVGVSLTVAALSLSRQLNLSDTAKADVTTKVALKPYTPTFEEWVDVWLGTEINVSAAGYAIMTSSESTVRGVRWRILLHFYSNMSAKRKETILKLWKQNKKNLQVKVNNWKRQGYDISIDDFVFIEN